MEDYLTLLREALDLLINIHKSCDPSVADYVLQIEVAVRFIHKALMTEDRLDIFKALQKAYDVLEKEDYDDQPENEDYNDLVERLEKALKGLQQQEGILKQSTLKKLTKFILKEIFLPPNKAELERQATFQSLQQSIEASKPVYLKTIQDGHKQAIIVLKNMVTNLKMMASASIRQDEKTFQKIQKKLGYNSEWFITFVVKWSNQIRSKDKNTFEAVDTTVREIRKHFNAMSDEGNKMFDSIRVYKNYINTSKDAERINEHFAEMRKAIDDLFQIGLNVGFGKEQPAVTVKPSPISVKKGEINWPDVPFTFETFAAQNPHMSKTDIRETLQSALKKKIISIKGMAVPLGGHGKPFLIFIKNK
jgi:hypothetical protein